MCILLLFALSDFFLCRFSFSTLILLLGLLTCKNHRPYNLYCIGRDVKHCSIQSNCLDRYCWHLCRKPITNCQLLIEPSDAHFCHIGTAILCQTRLRHHSWFLTSRHSDALGWALECLDVKNYKLRLNRVSHKIIYSCTNMATVGVKGLVSVSEFVADF